MINSGLQQSARTVAFNSDDEFLSIRSMLLNNLMTDPMPTNHDNLRLICSVIAALTNCVEGRLITLN